MQRTECLEYKSKKNHFSFLQKNTLLLKAWCQSGQQQLVSNLDWRTLLKKTLATPYSIEKAADSKNVVFSAQPVFMRIYRTKNKLGLKQCRMVDFFQTFLFRHCCVPLHIEFYAESVQCICYELMLRFSLEKSVAFCCIENQRKWCNSPSIEDESN